LIYLSIIIPVYNVEKYLEKCLLSILDSAVDSSYYEVIAINDGSTDHSLNILRDYQKLHSNLTVLSQSNSGLGATRNKGTALAKGAYIWFVDSDDWITPNAIEDIVKLADAEKPDVVTIDFEHSTGDKSPVVNNATPGIHYSGADYLLMSIVQNPAQYYIFNSNFYRQSNLIFAEKIYHEDSLFTPLALSLAGKVIFLGKICYIYNIRENSIMTSGGNNLKHANDMLTVVMQLMAFINDVRLDPKGRQALRKYIAIGVGAVFYYSKNLILKQKVKLSRDIPFFKLLMTILKSRKYKYLLSLLALKSAII
jgi:glycosyltransferase involved in cell wall biosynthesis